MDAGGSACNINIKPKALKLSVTMPISTINHSLIELEEHIYCRDDIGNSVKFRAGLALLICSNRLLLEVLCLANCWS